MGMRAFTCVLIRQVDEERVRRLAVLLGDAVWYRRGSLMRRIEGNIRRVLGANHADAEVRAASRRAARSYVRHVLENLQAPLSQAQLAERRSRTAVTGLEHLDASLSEGRGAVIAVQRMGNWEFSLALLAAYYPAVTVVVGASAKEQLRRILGATDTDLTVVGAPWALGSRYVFGELSHRLRGGGIVCILAEDGARGDGVEVRFLGASAVFPGGPAALALRSGAALLPVGMWFEPDGWGVGFAGEITAPSSGPWKRKIEVMTQRLATHFGEQIALRPEDWHRLDSEPLRPVSTERREGDDLSPVVQVDG